MTKKFYYVTFGFCHWSNIYSKRYNKFLLPVLAKAINESFGKTESEISNIVNYRNK